MSRKFFMFLTVLCLLTPLLYAQMDRYEKLDPKPFEITFQDDNGKTLTLKDFKGKIVLVNLWAPYCGPCVQELPSFQELTKVFTPEELVILPICTSLQYKEQARSTFSLGNFDRLKLYFDSTGSIMKALKAKGIPVTLVINKEGMLIGRLDGSTGWDYHENVQFIHDLLSGKSPDPSTWFGKLINFFKGK